ncbi:hypothetical protein BCV69DRAFT_297218 [Microstroma glucosiphilum]|uniref:FAD dependent oxidoreductase domain-containing protein n=1 Tax=Pseudomicrostroma glucosiphilum TaxID=1684307 RepID=A0A316UJ98_9BASI|nr:hypothetical protein BCV69DRAFT_297218 [Pseudomicrostroma glucosiphilum]PWN23275.1 hypothetical protein BCV69DRAFT_297218 [Pseudomicrostroma glucosiphilum]
MAAATSESSTPRPHVVILGGGVVGISLALCLLDVPEAQRLAVTIVAADLPVVKRLERQQVGSSGDGAGQASRPPASYASSWAGAHHVSSPSSQREARWEQDSFRVLKEIMKLDKQHSWSTTSAHSSSATHEEETIPPLCWVRQVELFPTRTPRTSTEAMMRGALKIYSHYSESGGLDPASQGSFFQPSTSLPSQQAYYFNTIDYNVPVYLPLLYERFLALGGRAIKRRVSSLAEARQAAADGLPGSWSQPSLIFASPGLGAGHLAELRDDKVFPVRGQTILVRAPWLRYEGADGSEEYPLWPAISRMNENGERDLYIIPRGGGEFIVGGTREVGKTEPSPNEQTTRAILQRALQICPSLLPPSKRPPPGVSPRTEDVDIIGLNVGLRPSRKGGPILEEWTHKQIDGAKVVLGYGFGGYGYQQSWGAAMEGRTLVYRALQRAALPDRYTLQSLEAAGVLRTDQEKTDIPGIRPKAASARL